MSGATSNRYIVNPGPKTAVRGLKAACSTDSAIVTETIQKVMPKAAMLDEVYLS
jgi:gamma-glutamyltranspeptidase / glutathione hydrolase